MSRNDTSFLDYIGVGIGPANLSLAALSTQVPSLRSRFYERAREFSWHPGLLFPESMIQTSYLKDLVTPVDPTNKYSFLSFLVAHKRFYSFLTAAFPHVTRAEFNQYLSWVARSLPNLEFDAPVDEIDFVNGFWRVRAKGASVLARDLVLGTGQSQCVPDFARPYLGPTVHHSNQFGVHKPSFAGKRVAVIGGGQAGAELVHHLLMDSKTLPSSLLWVSRRESFLPLDDSPFANEHYTPAYSDHFFQLDRAQKSEMLERQKLSSDGISMSLLQEIYRRIYTIELVEGRSQRVTHLRPNQKFVSLKKAAGGWAVGLRARNGQVVEEEADLVLLATGHHYRIPEFLAPVLDRVHRIDDKLSIRKDFSIDWDGPKDRRIFVQNAAKHHRGVADPNLSLLAWRSATILNSLAGREIHDCAAPESIMDWPAPSHSAGASHVEHYRAAIAV